MHAKPRGSLTNTYPQFHFRWACCFPQCGQSKGFTYSSVVRELHYQKDLWQMYRNILWPKCSLPTYPQHADMNKVSWSESNTSKANGCSVVVHEHLQLPFFRNKKESGLPFSCRHDNLALVSKSTGDLTLQGWPTTCSLHCNLSCCLYIV